MNSIFVKANWSQNDSRLKIDHVKNVLVTNQATTISNRLRDWLNVSKFEVLLLHERKKIASAKQYLCLKIEIMFEWYNFRKRSDDDTSSIAPSLLCSRAACMSCACIFQQWSTNHVFRRHPLSGFVEFHREACGVTHPYSLCNSRTIIQHFIISIWFIAIYLKLSLPRLNRFQSFVNTFKCILYNCLIVFFCKDSHDSSL